MYDTVNMQTYKFMWQKAKTHSAANKERRLQYSSEMLGRPLLVVEYVSSQTNEQWTSWAFIHSGFIISETRRRVSKKKNA